jgi:hypothetical protein
MTPKRGWQASPVQTVRPKKMPGAGTPGLVKPPHSKRRIQRAQSSAFAFESLLALLIG